MINYNTAIHPAGAAKTACYDLATTAFNSGDAEIQRELYQIADQIQVAIDALLELEKTQIKNMPTQDYNLLVATT